MEVCVAKSAELQVLGDRLEGKREKREEGRGGVEHPRAGERGHIEDDGQNFQGPLGQPGGVKEGCQGQETDYANTQVSGLKYHFQHY